MPSPDELAPDPEDDALGAPDDDVLGSPDDEFGSPDEEPPELLTMSSPTQANRQESSRSAPQVSQARVFFIGGTIALPVGSANTSSIAGAGQDAGIRVADQVG